VIKAGLIVGLISLFLAVGLALLSPVCVPCMTLLFGLGAGFLAGAFDRPSEGKETLRCGAFAGVIGGMGAMLGQFIGAVINSMIIGPEGTAQLMKDLGFQPADAAGFESGYWIGIVGSTMCFGFLDLVLMAGFGALGALIWGKLVRNKKQPEIEGI
jgi:hypothetical protein